MKKTTLSGVLALLCLYGTAQPKTIRPLYTGDRLPDISFTQVLSYTSTRASLSDFQDRHQKMILIDFWHTTCLPCIRSFKKLDSLQQLYKSQLQILLVTPEDSNTVKLTVSRWEKANNQKLGIPIITADTILSQYIYKKANPHYAWVAPDNVLLAQTSSSFITAEILQAYLKHVKSDADRRGYIKLSQQN